MNICYQKLQLAPDGEVVLRPVDAVWADLQSHALDGRSSLRILSDEDWQGDPFTQKATIDQVELVYFAMNTNGMWVGSIPADHPMRMVQPIWRFTGKLTDGTPLEILAEAAARAQSETSLSSKPTALPTQAGLPPSQTVTGEISQNGGDSTVNVRVGPSALFDQIGTLSSGQTVEVTGRSPHWEWWRIRAEGLEGWVYSAFMTVKNPQAVPCVEMNAGDCDVLTVPGGGEQAVVSIRAMTGDSNLALTFREETQNPNGELRKTWIYVDDQGEEYWVDQETLRVVQWMPKPAGPSGEVKTIDALRSLALTFAYHQSPRLEQNASSLTFTETTKDGSAYAFRWEDPDITGLMMRPFLQVIMRTDGQILQYMNTLDVLRP